MGRSGPIVEVAVIGEIDSMLTLALCGVAPLRGHILHEKRETGGSQAASDHCQLRTKLMAGRPSATLARNRALNEARLISCPKCYAQIAEGSNFCSECGHEIRHDASRKFDIYCSQCGHRITRRRDGPAETDGEFTRSSVQSSVPENVACVLTYLFWWITGLVFLITDKRRLVRFHAAQSVVVFGSLTAMEFATLRFARNAFMDQMWYSSLWFLGASIVGFVWVAMWVILMLHAYEKKPFRVPIAARIADRFAGA